MPVNGLSSTGSVKHRLFPVRTFSACAKSQNERSEGQKGYWQTEPDVQSYLLLEFLNNTEANCVALYLFYPYSLRLVVLLYSKFYQRRRRCFLTARMGSKFSNKKLSGYSLNSYLMHEHRKERLEGQKEEFSMKLTKIDIANHKQQFLSFLSLLA